MKSFITLLFSLLTLLVASQDQLDVIDILSYRISLDVSDENDTIIVDEQVDAILLKELDSFYLDLHSVKSGKGMTISKVKIQSDEVNKAVSFSHVENKLWISTSQIPVGTEFRLELRFSGVPETGLIIGKNKFEQRTFFGDNWPDRAHHWFACVDHPSEKARVSFSVTCPDKYDVIATGRLINQEIKDGKRIAHYVSEIQLPTKVMVVGIGEFAKESIQHDNTSSFPMTAWVYQEDAENGFNDMRVAEDVVNYFVEVIGDYPFEKLDHVQSTTQFGGMENAGNIFYDENAVTGKGTMEALIAHEVAHQWFGNSASESDWKHLWLSEGFATYFTDLYWENKYGTTAMNERLISERKRVLKFSREYQHPIIDTTFESLMDLLNPHSYQKGAWVLHMLRNEVGDSAFWNGIRSYYDTYKFSNATSADFQSIMARESKMDLSVFFNQWLKESLHPILLIKNKSKRKKSTFIVQQVQDSHLFDCALEIELIYADETTELRTFSISKKKECFEVQSEKAIKGFKYDPNVRLLFELIN